MSQISDQISFTTCLLRCLVKYLMLYVSNVLFNYLICSMSQTSYHISLALCLKCLMRFMLYMSQMFYLIA